MDFAKKIFKKKFIWPKKSFPRTLTGGTTFLDWMLSYGTLTVFVKHANTQQEARSTSSPAVIKCYVACHRIRSRRAGDHVDFINEGPRRSIRNQVRIQVHSSSVAVSEVAIDRPPHHSGKGSCMSHLVPRICYYWGANMGDLNGDGNQR